MLLPADTYVVINKSIITEVDQKIITDLYQPIIGNKAVSFYNTLLNDMEKNEIITENYNHHHLLSVMQMSLEDVLESREKLEAVGLLKTYLKKDNINNYIYVLYSPISANEFLNHPILNVVLYNNLGKKEYDKIKERYKLPKVSLRDYVDITSSFDNVFASVPTSSFFQNEVLISKNKNSLVFKNEIDFELLISGIDSSIINEKCFTKDIRSLINSLCFIYNIDVLTMQSLIKNNVNEKGGIDKDGLRKSSRSYYQFENNNNLPNLIYLKQPEYLKSPAGDNSKRAKMIYTFENTNPSQFLKSKYKDGKVVKRDLEIVETLLLDLKLSPGVVNVLLDYVMRVNNKKINRSYVETIASHWKRLGIETVPEAMEACKKEYNKASKTRTVSEKKKEIVPDWFNESNVVSLEENNEIKELLSKYN